MRTSQSKLLRALASLLLDRCIALVPISFVLSAAVTSSASAGLVVPHIVVDINGAGNFTSIQMAVDSLPTWQQSHGVSDTIEVRPGNYEETVQIDGSGFLVGTSGASAARVAAIVPRAGGMTYGSWLIVGLTVSQHVSWTWEMGNLRFDRCIFENGVSMAGSCSAPNIVDCEFRGRNALTGYAGPATFERLRFVGATLFTFTSACGPTTFVDCSFDGPADTLVSADAAGGENPLYFLRCRFGRARFGVVFEPSCENANRFDYCRFDDLSEAGIQLDEPEDLSSSGSSCTPQEIVVTRSFFEHCGNAVSWLPRTNSGAWMERDTIRNCTRSGIVAAVSGFPPGTPRFLDLIVEHNGGDGLEILPRGSAGPGLMPAVEIRNSLFADNAGDGVSLRDSSSDAPHPPSSIANCRLQRNGGDGLHVTSANWSVSHNVFDSNQGDGIDFTRSAVDPRDSYTDSVVSNTAVLNHGDGVRFALFPGVVNHWEVLQQNLVSQNGGAGIRVVFPFLGSVAKNDAWQNYAGQYVQMPSPLDSNLIVDPQFCDLALGDLSVHSTSPCAPSGPYGAIGAVGVGCAASVDAASTSPMSRCGIRPNPARGVAEFVSLSSGTSWTCEILDLSGRRVWSSEIRAGDGSVRWTGTTNRDQRAPAGLYWVRFTRGEQQRTVRFVWLN